MNTISITIENLIATAPDDAVIVSDNTGYQIKFEFDDAWEDYSLKTAVFVWYRNSLPYCQSIPFSGNIVQVPRLPAITRLYVGVTAGNLQTTTPARIMCQRSVLSSGGSEPETPEESFYARLMELIQQKLGDLSTFMSEISAISVWEDVNGAVTVVNTLEEGTETIVLETDANGDPVKLIWNGRDIPITWGTSQ